MKNQIYLDNNSTTQIDPDVFNYMLPYIREKYGNASSSTHIFGREAKEAVEYARAQISKLINCDKDEIIFTSGTTESINLALKGTIENSGNQRIHIITSVIEHSAGLEVCKYLEKYGIEISYIPVDKYGIINPDDIKAKIKKETVMVSIITANNEIGTTQPIAEIGNICREENILFHTDAAQAFGKIPINLKYLNVDMISFSAHKIYGPKGIGALYIRKGKKKPAVQIHGGGQENSMRGGTHNVPTIAGFGKAAEIARNKIMNEFTVHTIRRDRIIQNILNKVNGSFLNGHPVKRLPNNINVGFRNITNSVFINKYKEFAISTGSACSSETLQPSYVLKAIGRTKEEINSSVRIGIGRFNTEDEINYLIKRITEDYK
ncbi:MAG: cysteine desulfurase [Ignavibacteria bacterium]|nr:cysteine desulfurase [Ignavibacteria bacterium]